MLLVEDPAMVIQWHWVNARHVAKLFVTCWTKFREIRNVDAHLSLASCWNVAVSGIDLSCRSGWYFELVLPSPQLSVEDFIASHAKNPAGDQQCIASQSLPSLKLSASRASWCIRWIVFTEYHSELYSSHWWSFVNLVCPKNLRRKIICNMLTKIFR